MCEPIDSIDLIGRRLFFAQGPSHVTLRHVYNRKTAEAMGKASSAVAKLAHGVVGDGGSAAVRDWAKGRGRGKSLVDRPTD